MPRKLDVYMVALPRLVGGVLELSSTILVLCYDLRDEVVVTG